MRTSTVRDVMNPRLLYVREGDRMTLVRSQILKFGVTGVPVLDAAHRPIGFVSLRDFGRDGTVTPSEPAMTMRDDETLESGARKLAESGCRHLVVVDASGMAVGIVSAVDFLRAMTGVPVRHPPRFAIEPTHSED